MKLNKLVFFNLEKEIAEEEHGRAYKTMNGMEMLNSRLFFHHFLQCKK